MTEKLLAFLARIGFLHPENIHYIGGTDVLPPPLKGEEEQKALEAWMEMLASTGRRMERLEKALCSSIFSGRSELSVRSRAALEKTKREILTPFSSRVSRILLQTPVFSSEKTPDECQAGTMELNTIRSF